MKELKIKCPTCSKIFNYYAGEFRPFCSEQCRLIDLGQWLTESYTVPAEDLSDEEKEKLIRMSSSEEE